MSAPTPAEMVEKVTAELHKIRLGDHEGEPTAAVHRLIAAVLDNLPREVMARRICTLQIGVTPCLTCMETVASAISAARREVLGHE